MVYSLLITTMQRDELMITRGPSITLWSVVIESHPEFPPSPLQSSSCCKGFPEALLERMQSSEHYSAHSALILATAGRSLAPACARRVVIAIWSLLLLLLLLWITSKESRDLHGYLIREWVVVRERQYILLKASRRPSGVDVSPEILAI